MPKKIFSILEKILIIALGIPYAFFIIAFIQRGSYFLPLSLMFFFPGGIIILFLELAKLIFKIKVNWIIAIFCILNSCIGAFGLMLMCVVVFGGECW
jgi:hypothetical protein